MGEDVTGVESPPIQYWAGLCAVSYLTDGTLSSADISDFHTFLNTKLVALLGR
jgi:hypothetical protein